jgi:hypothetical protein
MSRPTLKKTTFYKNTLSLKPAQLKGLVEGQWKAVEITYTDKATGNVELITVTNFEKIVNTAGHPPIWTPNREKYYVAKFR